MLRSMECPVLLLQHPATIALRKLPAPPDMAVVGGAVRDLLLGRPLLDFDICVAGDPEAVAIGLKKLQGGTYFVLDASFGIVRYATRGGLIIDLAKRQGDSWQADLARRDLTINAMGIPLFEAGAEVIEGAILDPTGGRQDLKARCIRSPSRAVLEADPIRALRVFRFAATLAFTIDPATRQWATELGPLLAGVSRERVRDEFFKLLAADPAAPYVAALADAGLLERILPELTWLRGTVSSGHFDGFTHRLEAVRSLDALFMTLADWVPEAADWLARYFGEDLAGGHSKKALGRFLALTLDLGAFDPTPRPDDELHERIGRRLKLSITEIRWLGAGARGAAALDDLGPTPGGRAMYRYFRTAGDAAAAGALVALADHLAARDLTLDHEDGPAREARAVVAEASSPTVTASRPPLVRGDRLMAALGVPASPRLGDILEEIAEARAEGLIATEVEALELARRLLAI